MKEERRKIITDGTTDLSITVGGAAKVDGSATTQPISGTIAVSNFPATQSVNISQVGGASLTEGQKTMANSISVVMASDQSTIPVVLIAPTIATYSAATTGLATALLATDIFTITGSGTKTVKVYKIRVTCTRTGSTTSDFLLIKRSTANSGGTSTTVTDIPYDSTNAAGSATVLAYTANPTLGTTVGAVRSEKAFINVLGTGPSQTVEWTFGNGSIKPIVLRGTSEVLALNLNAGTVTGSSFNIFIEWTEE